VPVDRIPAPTPAGDPNHLDAWLEEQRSQSPRKVARYWSTVAGGWAPEDAIDADTATASHRLARDPVLECTDRAPVLPHSRHEDSTRQDQIAAVRRAALFGPLESPPVLPLLDGAHDYPPLDPDDIVKSALDYAYDPYGKSTRSSAAPTWSAKASPSCSNPPASTKG